MKEAIAVYARSLDSYADDFIGYVGIPKEEIIENNNDDITISSSAISIVEFVLKEMKDIIVFLYLINLKLLKNYRKNNMKLLNSYQV